MLLTYQLALAMGRTVGELLESMDAAEFVHWLALYDVDPWTQDRADWRAGMIAAVVANAMTGTKHSPADFAPKFGNQESAEISDEMLLLQGMKWACMMGGTIERASGG